MQPTTIKYNITNGYCLTPCPFNETNYGGLIHVASVSCQECKYYSKQNKMISEPEKVGVMLCNFQKTNSDEYNHTIQIFSAGFKIKATQKIIASVNLCHYNICIEDVFGNIVYASSSTGAPKEKIHKKFLREELKRYIDSNKELNKKMKGRLL